MTAARPRLGVGLPVYNGERFLAETLDSLLSQTYEDWVLVVADNASTDRTGEIVQDYAARDRRIEYLRHPTNIGVLENFNDVFRRAGTEYFRWHAADDLSLPTYTARCVDVLDSDPTVAVAYCKTMDIDQDGRELGPYEDGVHTPQPSPRQRFLQVMAKLRRCNATFGLMRSSMVERTRLLQPFLSSDLCFMAELALHGKFIEVPERLFCRRYHDGASSAMTEEERWAFNSARPAAPTHYAFRLWWGYWTATIRAPLPLEERARLQVDMLKRAYWSKGNVLVEASRVFRHRLGMGSND